MMMGAPQQQMMMMPAQQQMMMVPAPQQQMMMAAPQQQMVMMAAPQVLTVTSLRLASLCLACHSTASQSLPVPVPVPSPPAARSACVSSLLFFLVPIVLSCIRVGVRLHAAHWFLARYARTDDLRYMACCQQS